MRKRLAGVTLAALVLAAGAMVFAAVDASRSGATSTLRHSSKLSIKAPATATPGGTIEITGSEPRTPKHGVTATLQYKVSTSRKWRNGPSADLSGASYTISWTVPAKKGKYKVRVVVSHLSASRTSAVKRITVK